MKMTPMVVAILVEASAAIAFAVDVGTLPMADFADTEVSTNVVIDVSAEAPRRLRFSLELEASPRVTAPTTGPLPQGCLSTSARTTPTRTCRQRG